METTTNAAPAPRTLNEIRQCMHEHMSARLEWAVSTRYAQILRTIAYENVDDHNSVSCYDYSYFPRTRPDGSVARQPGTRWRWTMRSLRIYAVDQLVNHTSIWRCYIDRQEAQMKQFNEELNECYGWIDCAHFEGPYIELAKMVATDIVNEWIGENPDDRHPPSWQGTQLTDTELDDVRRALGFKRPQETIGAQQTG